MFGKLPGTLSESEPCWEKRDDRKHAIKALNGKVSLGPRARKRGSKATCVEEDQSVIVEIWKRGEQPRGKRLKPTIPLEWDNCSVGTGHHPVFPDTTARRWRLEMGFGGQLDVQTLRFYHNPNTVMKRNPFLQSVKKEYLPPIQTILPK